MPNLIPSVTHDGHAIHWTRADGNGDRALCGAQAWYAPAGGDSVRASCKRCIALAEKEDK